MIQWTFKNKVLTKDDVKEDWEGFVYVLIFTNIKTKEVKFYIGKKNFYTNSKRPLGKKELSTDKRKKTYKRVKTYNFEKYCGSSEVLTDYIDNIDWTFEKKIIRICKTKGDLTYYEAKYLMMYDALKRNIFLNNNILGTFYRKNLTEID